MTSSVWANLLEFLGVLWLLIGPKQDDPSHGRWLVAEKPMTNGDRVNAWLKSLDWSVEVPKLTLLFFALLSIFNAAYHFVPGDTLALIVAAVLNSGLAFVRPPLTSVAKKDDSPAVPKETASHEVPRIIVPGAGPDSTGVRRSPEAQADLPASHL